MFCRNCGKEFQEEVKFCDECGTYIGTEELKMVVTIPVVSYENVFVEKDERLLGKLGDGYVNTTSIRGKAKRMNALLTDKRLYLQGQMSVGAPGKRYMSPGIREKVLEHKDIISTEIIFQSQTPLIALAILMFAYVFMFIFISVEMSYAGAIFEQAMAVISFILGGAVLIRALCVKQKIFAIEYTGGKIQFIIKNADSIEAEGFLKKINSARTTKDRQ